MRRTPIALTTQQRTELDQHLKALQAQYRSIQLRLAAIQPEIDNFNDTMAALRATCAEIGDHLDNAIAERAPSWCESSRGDWAGNVAGQWSNLSDRLPGITVDVPDVVPTILNVIRETEAFRS